MPRSPMPGRTRIMILILLILAGTVIWIRTAVVEETYRFVALEKELHASRNEISSLRLQWLTLTSPQATHRYAKKLGMAPPKIHQTLRLKAQISGSDPSPTRQLTSAK